MVHLSFLGVHLLYSFLFYVEEFSLSMYVQNIFGTFLDLYFL